MAYEEDETAFPIVHPDGKGVQYFGITMRDYFAAKAMQAMISTAGAPCLFGLEGCEVNTAQGAYKMADAMLKVRNQ